jgi:CRISPR system Cascade subunit CasC
LSAIDALIARFGNGEVVADADIRAVVARPKGTADIALFGRMLTDLNKDKAKSLPEHQRGIATVERVQYSSEAACQVAHAISIHKVAIEDDYFTAMEELNMAEDRTGAAMVGTQEFASAVLYHYVCIDRGLLSENLGGDEALVQKTLRALGEACLTVAPNGKQNSFAARSRAHFALVEKGGGQPRSLASAFLKPVSGDDLLAEGVNVLQSTREKLDKIYEDAAPSRSFDVLASLGSKREVLDFLANA